MLKRAHIVAALLATLTIFLSVSELPAETANRVVAVVNGDMITQYQLDARLKNFEENLKEQNPNATLSDEDRDHVRRRILDSMIDNILLRDEAVRLGLEITNAEILSAVNRFKASNGLNDQQFEQKLAEERMTRADFEEKIREEMLRSRIVGVMVTRKIVVTPEEINAYYADYTASGGKMSNLPMPDQAGLHIITLPTDFKADELYKQLIESQISFADAAKQHSLGPATEEGGDLGVINPDELDPDWHKALSETTPGQPTKPFVSHGRIVILMMAKSGRKAASPDAMIKDQIRERLFQAKVEERFKEYIQTLRDRSIIDIRL